jgi:peroxiredoxin
MNGRPAAARLLVVVALLAGCAGPKASRPPRAGDPVPPYRAATLTGDTLALASLHGTPFLLNFWATWCTPCQRETPYLESVYRARSGQGLRVIGVSMDTGDALGQIRDFMKKYGVTYTVLRDPAMRAMDAFGIPGLPATFLVDRSGVVRWLRFGAINARDKDFTAALDDMLR